MRKRCRSPECRQYLSKVVARTKRSLVLECRPRPFKGLRQMASDDAEKTLRERLINAGGDFSGAFPSAMEVGITCVGVIRLLREILVFQQMKAMIGWNSYMEDIDGKYETYLYNVEKTHGTVTLYSTRPILSVKCLLQGVRQRVPTLRYGLFSHHHHQSNETTFDIKRPDRAS